PSSRCPAPSCSTAPVGSAWPTTRPARCTRARSGCRPGSAASAPGPSAACPVTVGYEMVSEVNEVAPDVHEVKVGDLVHTGTPHQEETVLDVAASLEATYPLVRLPTAERPERALFISLAAVALQAVHDAEMKLGDAVSVHGLGTIGLLTVQMCRLEGIQ